MKSINVISALLKILETSFSVTILYKKFSTIIPPFTKNPSINTGEHFDQYEYHFFHIFPLFQNPSDCISLVSITAGFLPQSYFGDLRG